jgi:hypothetical protein
MKIDITKIKANQSNPRVIKDFKFKKLVQSIQEFPEMLEKRPIVVDEEMIVLGGNMRLKACIEAGLKKIDVIIAEGWSEKQKQEFIIKDNVGYGEWDWDVLANEWDINNLNNWDIDLPLDFNEDLKDEDLDGEEKKEKPSIKITFQNVEDLEEAELSIKDLTLKYQNSFYSVS